MTEPLLRLEGLTKRYGPVEVLRGIGFDVGANEFLTILGPSGSGKTTVLRLIGGFEAAGGGRILFEGRDIARVPINRRPFNTVFQDYALFGHMSVRRNVAYGLHVRRLPAAEIAARVDAVLETVGLGALGDRFPDALSGGQRQRVALARAIVCEPRIILLDEPLSALDVALRAQMRQFLKSLQRRLAIAFVFITHDQEEAITLSDRIVVMRDGRIEQVGTPDAVYWRPETPFVAGFFGDNNLIEGTLAGRDASGFALVDTAFGRLLCPAADAAGPVLVAVRPEGITVGAADGPDLNRVAGTVVDVQFGGPNVVAEVAPCAGGPALKVRLLSRPHEQPLVPGAAVALSWPAGASALVARA